MKIHDLQRTTNAAEQTAGRYYSFGQARAIDNLSDPAVRIETAVTNILEQAPFIGRYQRVSLHVSIRKLSDWCVCIPLRDEEQALPPTLEALAQAIERCDSMGAVVFIVNDTCDSSKTRVMAWAERHAIPHVVVDIAFEQSVRGAPHARRLALDIGACVAAEGSLLTTDADTLVREDWIVRNLAHLADGADLVCGAVDVNEDAIDALRGNVRRCGAIEAEYFRLLHFLWDQWTGGGAPPLTLRAMGASLAISTRAYRLLGGLPTPGVAEDKALATLARSAGLVTVEASDVRVVTSCRTDSRATGGMGDALRDRVISVDPECDETLVPVAVLRRRADAWNTLCDDDNAERRFIALCLADPTLSSERMHMFQVERELELAGELFEHAVCEPRLDERDRQ